MEQVGGKRDGHERQAEQHHEAGCDCSRPANTQRCSGNRRTW
jgi:hypothetical protein